MGSLVLAKRPNIIAGFSPKDVGGLKLWLAADRLTHLIDGDPVGSWIDASGNGNDVTQATATNKPTFKTGILNGKPVVRFDGGVWLSGGDILDFDYLDKFTLFVVQKNTAGVGDQSLIGKFDSASPFQGWELTYVADTKIAAGLVSDWATNNALWLEYNTTLTSNHIVTMRYNGNATPGTGDLGLWRDGIALALSATVKNGLTATSVNAIPFTIGARNNGAANKITGDIAEIIIYNRALADAVSSQVLRYLGSKWGISVP